MKQSTSPLWRVGIDTGGTFTDLVALGPDGPVEVKVPSHPQDPSRAVHAALQEFHQRRPDARRAMVVIHGSTVATNALLEQRLGRVVLVTNQGFEDLIEIGRQARDQLYALEPGRAPALVAARDRIGVPERTTATGERQRVPAAVEIEAMIRQVARRSPDAIAIGLLHAYRNPAAEKQIRRALQGLGTPLCTSHEVAPRIREYERLSTTVANAALLPVMQDYLRQLQRRIRGTPLWMMQSSGGLTDMKHASRFPVQLVLSGPAGGLHAAERFAADDSLPPLVTLDMGGTSTDVGLIIQKARRTDQIEPGDRPLMVEAVELHTIGAGGGSQIWLDTAGSLRVGPASSGADPGPACYGRGTVPCVTDAHAVLGRLPLKKPLGGSVQLQPDRSQEALSRLARKLSRSLKTIELARAVLDITDAAMVRAIKQITLESTLR